MAIKIWKLPRFDDYLPGRGVHRRLRKKLEKAEEDQILAQVAEADARGEPCEEIQELVPRREYTADEGNNNWLRLQIASIEPDLLEKGVTKKTLEALRAADFDVESLKPTLPPMQYRLLQSAGVREDVAELADAVEAINISTSILDDTERADLRHSAETRNAEDKRRSEAVARIRAEREREAEERKR